MKDKITVAIAKQELKIAGEQNPGPWTEHSQNVGLAAKRSICIKTYD